MAFVPNHIYVISCAGSSTVLDLVDGSSENGTACHSYTDQSDNINGFNQMWLVKEVDNQRDSYTLRNLRSGTYLDLSEGRKSNGTKIQGWAKAQPMSASDQQWKIISTGNGNYRIQNLASGTFVDIKDCQLAPGGTIHAWEFQYTMTQQWKFRRVSRAAHEINALVEINPFLQQRFKTYTADGLYITLCDKIRNDIYDKTGLKRMEWREEIYDCDDFAFSVKAAVAKWGTENLRADGFAILFGIMFGTNNRGAGHSYNWYLNNNLNGIVFFEPQNGTQQDNIGYQAYFGIF